MTNLQKGAPFPIFHRTGYRRFTSYWWKDQWDFFTTGWFYDLRTAYHRMRYGWAPRDTWSFDHYLSDVIGGGLIHLAANKHGSPIGYPFQTPHVIDRETGKPRPQQEGDSWEDHFTDHDQWQADLERWGKTLLARNEDLHDHPDFKGDYRKINEEEQRRYEAVVAALHEMTPWWGSLWD